MGEVNSIYVSLLETLNVLVPQEFKQHFGIEEIPFSPSLIRDLTEKQFIGFRALFEMDSDGIADEITSAYVYANIAAIGGRIDAKSVCERIHHLVPHESIPEVSLLVVFSFYCQTEKDYGGSTKEGILAEWDARAKTGTAALIKCVDELLELTRLVGECDSQENSKLMLPGVANWLEENGFVKCLYDLRAVIERDAAHHSSSMDVILSRGRQYHPSRQPEVMSHFVMAAVDRVAEIIGTSRGKKNRDLQSATALFAEFGLIIDQGALKQARYRRKRKQ